MKRLTECVDLKNDVRVKFKVIDVGPKSADESDKIQFASTEGNKDVSRFNTCYGALGKASNQIPVSKTLIF